MLSPAVSRRACLSCDLSHDTAMKTLQGRFISSRKYSPEAFPDFFPGKIGGDFRPRQVKGLGPGEEHRSNQVKRF
jgi:hypothetical protein